MTAYLLISSASKASGVNVKTLPETCQIPKYFEGKNGGANSHYQPKNTASLKHYHVNPFVAEIHGILSAVEKNDEQRAHL